MRPLKPQKIYVDEKARRRDQQGGGQQPDRGLWGVFNDLASEKSQNYRRKIFDRAAALEMKIEDGLQNIQDAGLCAEWSKILDDVKGARISFKVSMSENALSDCMKARQLNKTLEKLEKKCPF